MFQWALARTTPPPLVKAKRAGGEGRGGGGGVGCRFKRLRCVCVSTHQKTISMLIDELVSET